MLRVAFVLRSTEITPESFGLFHFILKQLAGYPISYPRNGNHFAGDPITIVIAAGRAFCKHGKTAITIVIAGFARPPITIVIAVFP